MAPNGPPDDVNNQPTWHANAAGQPGTPPPTDRPEPAEPPDSFGEETEPTAWYRRPAGLIIWGLSVLILIALIVYGILQLAQAPGTGNTPSRTSTTTTTATTTTTTPTTTATTTAPSTTTTTSTEAVIPPSEQPTRQPTQQQPTHRHHWPSWLPSSLPSLP